MKKILFVCTGNTCRSPMAEAFLKEALEKDPSLGAEYSAASAGISAFQGDKASAYSNMAMKEGWGIDLGSHAAAGLTNADMENAYLILAMTKSHKDAVISMFPQYYQKVHTLKEYVNRGTGDTCGANGAGRPAGAPGSSDIPDPYGAPYGVYVKCAEDIREAVEKLVEKLKNGNPDV